MIVRKMSAFRPHTCLLQTFIRFKSHKSYSRTFCAKFLTQNSLRIHLPKKYFAPLINGTCLYSKEAGSLTDDILKSRTIVQPEDQPKTEAEEEGEKKKESKWTGKNSWKLGLLSLGGMMMLFGGSFIFMWGAPIKDPEGQEYEDEFSHLPKFKAYLKRAWKEARKQKQAIVEPSREKLLPDPVQYPYYQPPYTLVIEMNGVLLHPDWTYGTGWRFKKRPHVEYFLQNIAAPLYEVVVYTQDSGMNAAPIVHNLDGKGYINYSLFRDATRYMDGHHVKDLGCLNRDLSKVIFIDWNEKSYSLQPRNALKLNKWDGRDDDRSLIDLANFLQAIAASKVEDVREVLDYYKQFDDPLEAFKDNQRKLQEEQDRMAKEAQEREKKMPSFRLGTGSFLGRR